MPPNPLRKDRPLFIAGNWKMHKTLDEAKALAGEIARGVPRTERVQVALFPPAISLAAVVETVRAVEASAGALTASPKPRPIVVGAQNIHFPKSGAYTGEISSAMVLSAGGTAVLVGHSERRQYFGESDDLVAKKVFAALEAGLVPVLCVGEKLEEREAGRTFDVVRRQLAAVADFLEAKLSPGTAARSGEGAPRADGEPLTEETRERVRQRIRGLIVAYEPVWAIGTGRTATPEQGQEVQRFLRAELRAAFPRLGLPEAAAGATQILYGGSVQPKNAKDLLAEPDIDGLLVGGASLDAASFLAISSAGI